MLHGFHPIKFSSRLFSDMPVEQLYAIITIKAHQILFFLVEGLKHDVHLLALTTSHCVKLIL